MKSAF